MTENAIQLDPDDFPKWHCPPGGEAAVAKAASCTESIVTRVNNLEQSAAADPSGRLKAVLTSIRSLIKKTELTINTTCLHRACHAITGSPYCSGYEWCRRETASLHRGIPEDAIDLLTNETWAAEQGEWLRPRMLLENVLNWSHDVVFGALTVDGAGLGGAFGDICLVVEPDPRWNITCFIGNSAAHAQTLSGEAHLISQEIESRYGLFDNAAELLIARKANEIVSEFRERPSYDSFRQYLSNPEKMIEVQIHQQIPKENISKIRIKSDYVDRIYRSNLKYQDCPDELVPQNIVRQQAAFGNLKAACERNNVPLEIG